MTAFQQGVLTGLLIALAIGTLFHWQRIGAHMENQEDDGWIKGFDLGVAQGCAAGAFGGLMLVLFICRVLM